MNNIDHEDLYRACKGFLEEVEGGAFPCDVMAMEHFINYISVDEETPAMALALVKKDHSTEEKGLNVLSLFDGISCGKVAIERAGFKINQYYASEIDKPAIEVSKDNHPEIIRMGDIEDWKNWDIEWSKIDLIVAGSPCQGFSFSGKQLAFDDPRSQLFFKFVDIYRHIEEKNPKVKFLLENVKMKKETLTAIDKILGVESLPINSKLLSGQSRPRHYWANWDVSPPEDKGVLLADILEPGEHKDYWISEKHKKRLLTSTDLKKHFSAIEPDKALCMTARQYGNWKGTYIKVGESDYRQLTHTECERLQTLPDGYTRKASNAQRYKMLGNGWTVDVVAHLIKQAKF